MSDNLTFWHRRREREMCLLFLPFAKLHRVHYICDILWSTWNFIVFFELLKCFFCFLLACLPSKHYYQNGSSWNWTKYWILYGINKTRYDSCHCKNSAHNNMIAEWKMIWWRRRSYSNCNWLHLYLFEHKILIKFSSIHWSFWLFYYHRCFVILWNPGDIFSSTKKRASIPICPTETTTERKKTITHTHTIFISRKMNARPPNWYFYDTKYAKCVQSIR